MKSLFFSNTGLGLLFALALMGCQPTVETPPDNNRPVYIERLGVDTMSVETYRRNGSGLSGEIVIRSPLTQRIRYDVRLSDANQVSQMEVEWTVPDTNPQGHAPHGYHMTISGDSATVIRWTEGKRDTNRVAVPGGVIPVTGKQPLAYGMLDQALRQAGALRTDTLMLPFFFGETFQLQQRPLWRIAPDTMALDFFGNPMIIGIDSTGRVRWRSGARTTLKVEGERALGALNLDALARTWAARDAAGTGLGAASPQTTLTADIDGAKLSVVYSRPAKRGRKIWDGLVPFGTVWRTGANAATAFSTDRDLAFGNITIPAGNYTLYSHYTGNAADLLINQQVGQWGTVYDERQDLARIPLRASKPDSLIEQFTITLEDTPEGGTLHLLWDDGRFSAPFRVR